MIPSWLQIDFHASTCPLPHSTAKLPLQDMDYRGDVRQLLSLSEVLTGNISAGLLADIIAVVNPKAAYRAAAGDVPAYILRAPDDSIPVVIEADGALQRQTW